MFTEILWNATKWLHVWWQLVRTKVLSMTAFSTRLKRSGLCHEWRNDSSRLLQRSSEHLVEFSTSDRKFEELPWHWLVSTSFIRHTLTWIIRFVGSGPDHWTGHRSLNHMAVLKSSQKLVGKCGSEKSNDVSPCAVDIYVGHHRGQYRREWKRLLLILLQSLESWACFFGVIWSLFQVVRRFFRWRKKQPKAIRGKSLSESGVLIQTFRVS